MTGVAALGLITVLEGVWARERLLSRMQAPVPPRTGVFGAGYGGTPIEFALLGDSLAFGYGADDPDRTVGVLLAQGLADAAQRPVRLSNAAVVGDESEDLAAQIATLERLGVRPDVVVIVIGGNDVMHVRNIGAAVGHLSDAVRTLRQNGSRVIVATCPDMGTVRRFFQPLRYLAHVLSRLLATAQTIVVLRAGGRTVSLADTLGPVFSREPSIMFSTDHLHPSSEGYAAAAAVLLPSVRAAAGYQIGRAHV